MKQYVVDAFTDKVFSGNPAAVLVMDSWLPDETMMKITRENNLSETAFAVPEGGGYRLRWFTPGGEIDLCGHATLATAHVLMSYECQGMADVTFNTMSGELTVIKRDGLYEMDFPAYEMKPVPVSQDMIEAMGAVPKEAYLGRDLLCVFEEEETVRGLNPDMNKLAALPGLLQHVTAQGKEIDCVSRSFAPKLQVVEDPVCGSGHCHIIPYWASKLKKDSLVAYQASQRGGMLYCRMENGRVKLAGKAAIYSIAELFIGGETPG